MVDFVQQIGKHVRQGSANLQAKVNAIVSEVDFQKRKLMHSYAAKVGVVSDLEGSWEKLQKFAERSTVLKIIKSSDPDNFEAHLVGERDKLVFIGDAIDKGPNNIKILKFLLYMKKRYPDRVFLILGNRDINKLRFNWELRKESLILNNPENSSSFDRFRIHDWEALFQKFVNDETKCVVDGVKTEYTHGKNVESDRILKMKFLFANTMGSPNEFEDIRKELGNVSDREVCDFYQSMIVPNGLLANYLLLGQLAYRDSSSRALYLHGGIDDDSFGYVPESKLGMKDSKSFSDINTWIDRLNAWALASIKAGIRGDTLSALPIIQYQEPLIILDSKNRPTWKNMIPNSISVIHGRPWSEDYNLTPADENCRKILLDNGVNKVVFGHSPVGQLPVIMKSSDGFLTVATDTSVTDPFPRVATVEVSQYGVHVEGVYVDVTEENRHFSVSYHSWEPDVGVQDLETGAWNICKLVIDDKNKTDSTPSTTTPLVMNNDNKTISGSTYMLSSTWFQAEFGGKKHGFGLPKYEKHIS